MTDVDQEISRHVDKLVPVRARDELEDVAQQRKGYGFIQKGVARSYPRFQKQCE